MTRQETEHALNTLLEQLVYCVAQHNGKTTITQRDLDVIAWSLFHVTRKEE